MYTLPLFVLNAEVERLEGVLAELQGAARLPTLVGLAWHLRQRDCKRCMLLLAEAQQLLGAAQIPDIDRQRINARITLTQAEERLVFADLESAQQLCKSALDAFDLLGDRLGMGDALWTRASLAIDRGDGEKTDSSLLRAMALYA